jgi:hypothetical protein
MSPPRRRPDAINRRDPRVAETIKHLKIIARRHNRRLVVQDYLEYRARHAPELPALTTVYRLFSSWPEALAAAGVDRERQTELSRTSDEALIAALKKAAEGLGVTVLSSHAYDDYRRSNDPELPSSSVIRKWLGRWAQAVKQAGLETTERQAPHRPTMAEVIEAIRKAKDEVGGRLTPRAYSEYHAALPAAERDTFPDISQILHQFPNWEAALRAADVEQSDTLHAHGLWSADEARRISQQVERVLGRPLDEAGYSEIRRRSRRPMPSWQVLNDLLSS